MSKKEAVIIFSRVPEKGRVKKRLAKELGANRVFELFRALFVRCLQELAPLDVARFACLSATSGIDTMELLSSWPILKEFEIFAQQGMDLGERMRSAFYEVFSQGIDKAVLVGTDIPGLRRRHVAHALDMIGHGHVPVGPCEDGGYYLIGLKKDLGGWEDLFWDVPWGSSQVLDVTLQRTRELHFEARLLEPLYDVDVKSDYLKWIQAQDTAIGLSDAKRGR